MDLLDSRLAARSRRDQNSTVRRRRQEVPGPVTSNLGKPLRAGPRTGHVDANLQDAAAPPRLEDGFSRGSNRKCHEGQGSRLPLNEEYDAEDKTFGPWPWRVGSLIACAKRNDNPRIFGRWLFCV
ncbi:unnamed protein product [Durusdinium trenchii]|uniref:Uncharacterized protein n=1 Tax=Durusdinium trenchii TaxID=1381693 RepID=A0ABP0PEX4_9DINO